MLYLGIDQHRKQLTVNLRNEAGDVILRRQVSTHWDKVKAFFAELQKQAEGEGGYMSILEVCGFNDWLLKMLAAYDCREIVLVQTEKRSQRKTDRRDANTLGELLWVNRHRLLAGQRVNDLRRVQPASPADAEARQLTSLRQHLGQQPAGITAAGAAPTTRWCRTASSCRPLWRKGSSQLRTACRCGDSALSGISRKLR